MFERYTENARRAVFFSREEASRVGSSCIEAEHLLLGVMRSCERELNELLNLGILEGALRADLAATAQRDTTSDRLDFLPLSNQSKRTLAYAAEEAERLNSTEISSGHLLLGILRESESVASHFLAAHTVDLERARQMMAMLSQSHIGAIEQSRAGIGWASTAKRRYWIGTAVQIALLILFGVGVARSTVTGKHLLVVGAIWFLAALAWNILGPSSFAWSFGKRNRVIAMAIAYAFGWLHQLFMLGWLFLLVFGIYRVATR